VWSSEGSYGSKTSAYINLVGYPDKVQEQTSYVRQFLADNPDAVQEQTSYVRQFLVGHPKSKSTHRLYFCWLVIQAKPKNRRHMYGRYWLVIQTQSTNTHHLRVSWSSRRSPRTDVKFTSVFGRSSKVKKHTSFIFLLVCHPDAFHEHTPFACQLTGHPDAVQEPTPYVHHVLHFRRDS